MRESWNRIAIFTREMRLAARAHELGLQELIERARDEPEFVLEERGAPSLVSLFGTSLVSWFSGGMALLLAVALHVETSPDSHGLASLLDDWVVPGTWLLLTLSCCAWIFSCFVRHDVPMVGAGDVRPHPMLPIPARERAAALVLAAWLPAGRWLLLVAAFSQCTWWFFALPRALGLENGPFVAMLCGLLILTPAFVAAGFGEACWADSLLSLDGFLRPPLCKATVFLLVLVAPWVAGAGALWSVPLALSYALLMSLLVALVVPYLTRRIATGARTTRASVGVQASAARDSQTREALPARAALRRDVWDRFWSDLPFVALIPPTFFALTGNVFLFGPLEYPVVLLGTVYLSMALIPFLLDRWRSTPRLAYRAVDTPSPWDRLPITHRHVADAMHLRYWLDAGASGVAVALTMMVGFGRDGLTRPSESLAYLALILFAAHVWTWSGVRYVRVGGPRIARPLLLLSCLVGVTALPYIVGRGLQDFRLYGALQSRPLEEVALTLILIWIALTVYTALACRKLDWAPHVLIAAVLPAALQWNMLAHWEPAALPWVTLGLGALAVACLVLLYRTSHALFVPSASPPVTGEGAPTGKPGAG